LGTYKWENPRNALSGSQFKKKTMLNKRTEHTPGKHSEPLLFRTYPKSGYPP